MQIKRNEPILIFAPPEDAFVLYVYYKLKLCCSAELEG